MNGEDLHMSDCLKTDSRVMLPQCIKAAWFGSDGTRLQLYIYASFVAIRPYQSFASDYYKLYISLIAPKGFVMMLFCLFSAGMINSPKAKYGLILNFYWGFALEFEFLFIFLYSCDGEITQSLSLKFSFEPILALLLLICTYSWFSWPELRFQTVLVSCNNKY